MTQEKHLTIFDMDKTIANGNTVNSALKAFLDSKNIPDDPSEAIKYLRENCPAVLEAAKSKYPELWREAIREEWKLGNVVGIATFNGCRTLVLVVLHLLDLKPDEIRRIHIEASPSNNRTQGKNNHIRNLLEKVNKIENVPITQPPRLFDDSQRNCSMAEQIGVIAIKVSSKNDDDKKHFTRLHELQENQKQRQELAGESKQKPQPSAVAWDFPDGDSRYDPVQVQPLLPPIKLKPSGLLEKRNLVPLNLRLDIPSESSYLAPRSRKRPLHESHRTFHAAVVQTTSSSVKEKGAASSSSAQAANQSTSSSGEKRRRKNELDSERHTSKKRFDFGLFCTSTFNRAATVSQDAVLKCTK